jgi:hypothetical protein
VSNAEHERTTRLVLSGVGLYVLAGAAGSFFWLYAVWGFLKQDRFIEAAIAVLLAPLSMFYGFLRFFGWL